MQKKTFADVEMSAVEGSYIESEVDALLWLYERSSMSADHRLVIHALPGTMSCALRRLSVPIGMNYEMRNKEC